nr:hypothetical protein [Methylobacterium durans]
MRFEVGRAELSLPPAEGDQAVEGGPVDAVGHADPLPVRASGRRPRAYTRHDAQVWHDAYPWHAPGPPATRTARNRRRAAELSPKSPTGEPDA